MQNDISFLVSLRKKTMKQYIENTGSAYLHEEQLKRIMYEFEFANIVVFNKNDIGLLKLKKNDELWEIIQIQILPEYQNMGLGSSILKQIISESEQQKADVKLSVLKSNPALNLYKRNGFKIINEEDISYTMRYSPG